ncbi:MAG: crosslink repair DNA glycosylase YcaQ family protein, partial [Burkholderiaceae bacterium]
LILSAQAHGLGTADDLIDYFRLPIRAARPLFDSLVEDGRLIVCQVEGWKAPAYAPTGQMLRSIRRQASGTDQRRALLSPFDPVVWYRKRALRLFNFDYRLEIYTPEKKRRWGYYVFPFLLGDALVGRCDLKFDRNTGVLRVPAAHIEAGSSPDRVAPAMAAELMLMAQWLGAKRVVAGRRGGLISALRAALKAFE